MLLVLAACTTLEPTWLESPACDNEPYGWVDDLGGWVAAGEGDGSFALDPAGDAAGWVEGEYDPSSGSFSWERLYGEDYWLESERVEDGVGTVFHDGDLSLEYVVKSVDRLDASWRTGWRVERQECFQEWWTWDAAADSPTYTRFEGSYSRTAFEWTADVEGVEWSGVRRDDGSAEEHYASGKNEQDLVYRVDGTSRREFSMTDSNYTYEGADEHEWNGDYTQEYRILDGKDELCTVEAEYDYDGDGKAVYDCDGQTFECDYEVDDEGACTYSCDDGSKGDC